MKQTKKTRPLPTRGGLNDLSRSGRTIADYAKATPGIAPADPAAVVNLANPRKAK